MKNLRKWLVLIFQNKKAAVGIVLLILLALVAIFAPLIAPYGYEEMQTGANMAGPSWQHPMGTDNFGRDIFSRVIYGTRISFGLSLLVVALSFVIGVPLGLVAGYFGGKIDSVINGFANSLLSFPWLLMALTVTAIKNGLTFINVDAYWQDVVFGLFVLIMIVISIDRSKSTRGIAVK